MSKRAVIYTRKSADRSGRALSVSEQEEAARKDCQREGWTVARVFQDNDRSSSRYARKVRSDFEELIAFLQRGEADVLVCWQASRLQRDLATYSKLRDICARNNVLWAYGGRVYDLTRGNDRFTTGMEALIAEKYAEEIHDNLMRSVEARASRGAYHGGQIAFGYRAEGIEVPENGKTFLKNVRIVVVPEHAALIKEAAEHILMGGSANGVAHHWTALGIRGPQGGKWGSTRVRQLLVNPMVAGKRVASDGRLVDAAWDAILDLETHERLKAVLEQTGRTRTRNTQRHVLSGIAACAACTASRDEPVYLYGHARPSTSGRGTIYRCEYAPPAQGCGFEVLARSITDPARDAVLYALASSKFRKRLEAAAQASGGAEDVVPLVAEDKALDARLDELRDALADPSSGVELADFTHAKGKIDARKAEIFAALSQHRDTSGALLSKLPTTFKALQTEWKTWSNDYRRAIFRLAVHRIEVSRPGRGHRIDPETHLRPVWRV